MVITLMKEYKDDIEITDSVRIEINVNEMSYGMFSSDIHSDYLVLPSASPMAI